MEFVEFKEQTIVIAKDQPQYLPLPAFQVLDKAGTTIVRMQFSPEELEYINKTGGCFMSVMTFGKPFPPMMIIPKDPFPVIQEVTDELYAIYYKDIDTVMFYNANGEQLLVIPSQNFDGKWIPAVGFRTFAHYRFDKNSEGVVALQVTFNKKNGVTIKLQPQYWNKEVKNG